MASRELKVEIDLIGKPQFRRLVEFLEAVDAYADEECDLALQELVEEVRDDLRRLH